MQIRDALAMVNRMQRDGVIDRYAIGGAVGATFYIEAVATIDIDIFVALHPQPGRRIVSLKPILDYLAAKGCAMDGEHVVIAGWPVQFLPATSPLLEEALSSAREFEVEGEIVWVFRAEHLLAVALQTGRRKDKERVAHLIESGVLDQSALKSIISRHGLQQQWRPFAQAKR